MFSNLKETWDDFLSLWERDAWAHVWNWISPTVLFALQYLCPAFFGGILGDALTRIYGGIDGASWLDFRLWREHWLMWPFLAATVVGIFWQRVEADNKLRASYVHREVEQFHEEMGFLVSRAADIRCTIWVPAKRKTAGVPVRLMQLIDYIPGKSSLPPSSGGGYHRNSRAGRTFRVVRYVKKREVPIGLVGECVLKCVNEKEPGVHRDVVPDGVNFVDYQMDRFHFKRRHAKHLTQDRRSCLCIGLMDRERTTLLGVIYIDSRDPNALNEEVGRRAERFLPKIAGTIAL